MTSERPHTTPAFTQPAADDRRHTAEPDPLGPVAVLLRDLRTSPTGLSTREATARARVHGPNVLVRRQRSTWPRQIVRQLTHPLALLLWAAMALSAFAAMYPITWAVLVVIIVNATFAFVQEQQAERAVEALQAFLPITATVLRDGKPITIAAAQLYPGDVIIVSEGDRISADARLLDGAVEIDLSALTGESQPVMRVAHAHTGHVPLLESRDVVFSGTSCTQGDARAVVFATGMSTQIGRIAALSEGIRRTSSPLELQVRRVAWIITAVAVISGAAFVPLAMFATGLPPTDAVMLSIGLIVGNVPEGLLPVITLALAGGVRQLARHGAIVKRLSAVETLGSTSVICTDKTGTLTENRMEAVQAWSPATGSFSCDTPPQHMLQQTRDLARALAYCTNAELGTDAPDRGDPTEIGLLYAARMLGWDASSPRDHSHQSRRALFHFDPVLKLMSTVDQVGDVLMVHTKGAPESVLERCDISDEVSDAARRFLHDAAGTGLRVLAIAQRPIDRIPADRRDAEQSLQLLGLIALHDPPRPEVAAAVVACHTAGIRIIMVTGDHPVTAAAIAQQIGIVGMTPRVVTEHELDDMPETELDALLASDAELVFARSTPEAKLRIASSLESQHCVVAMTGDGVNDAPALRRADIGIAMGASGTDVAREAATVVLADDNFATIVSAIHMGRVIYANIRKFIVYIFAHLTPEIVPFLVFALSGGSIPLPLTIMQLLAFDVGTETLPALALGREPAEPGILTQPPRPAGQQLVQTPMLLRAWLFLGVIAATLQMAAYLHVLLRAGWSPGDDVSVGSALHHTYMQATTVTFLSMVAAQIGTAYAARTDRASIRQVGVWSNPLLLWGIAFEVAIAAAFVSIPPLQQVLGTALPDPIDLAIIASFPIIVWGADEVRKLLIRRHVRRSELRQPS